MAASSSFVTRADRRLRGIELCRRPRSRLIRTRASSSTTAQDVSSSAPDSRDLTGADAHDEAYLQDLQSVDGAGAQLGPAAFGLELTRLFRGLRLWLPLMLHGAAAFANSSRRNRAGAAPRGRPLRSMWPAAAPPSRSSRRSSSASCHSPERLARRGAHRNARNAAFLEAINDTAAGSSLSSTSCRADGPVLTLRACVLSHRTQARNIAHGLEDIAAAAEAQQVH